MAGAGKSIKDTMGSREDIKNQLKREGYRLIHEYSDAPNDEFPDHDHEGDQLMIIVEGSIAVRMGGKDYVLKARDELRVPAKVKHSAKVSAEGCKYLVGEK